MEFHLPHLTTHDDGYEELSGYVAIDTNMPWPRLAITHAALHGRERFAVDEASIDISYTGSRSHKFVQLAWLENRRHSAARS
ncbi:hypothetical protein [Streptomyces wedmorensis]